MPIVIVGLECLTRRIRWALMWTCSAGALRANGLLEISHAVDQRCPLLTTVHFRIWIGQPVLDLACSTLL